MTLEGGWLAAGPQMITLPASCRSFAHATGTACPFLGANARTWIDPGAYRHVCFSGEGGTGKSLVALQLAVAMALGTK
jgi:hypothetical protein